MPLPLAERLHSRARTTGVMPGQLRLVLAMLSMKLSPALLPSPGIAALVQVGIFLQMFGLCRLVVRPRTSGVVSFVGVLV